MVGAASRAVDSCCSRPANKHLAGPHPTSTYLQSRPVTPRRPDMMPTRRIAVLTIATLSVATLDACQKKPEPAPVPAPHPPRGPDADSTRRAQDEAARRAAADAAARRRCSESRCRRRGRETPLVATPPRFAPRSPPRCISTTTSLISTRRQVASRREDPDLAGKYRRDDSRRQATPTNAAPTNTTSRSASDAPRRRRRTWFSTASPNRASRPSATARSDPSPKAPTKARMAQNRRAEFEITAGGQTLRKP